MIPTFSFLLCFAVFFPLALLSGDFNIIGATLFGLLSGGLVTSIGVFFGKIINSNGDF